MANNKYSILFRRKVRLKMVCSVLLAIIMVLTSVQATVVSAGGTTTSESNPLERKESPDDELKIMTAVELTSLQLYDLVKSMSTSDFIAAVTEIEYQGIPGQFAIIPDTVQGFPTHDDSFVVFSSGFALNTPGQAPTFISSDLDGGFKPGFSPYGHDANDWARLSITLEIPFDATTLSFHYKFATEESPTFLYSIYQDYFRPILEIPELHANVLFPILPDDSTYVSVRNAIPYYTSIPEGSSGSPLPPFPEPNDTAFNSVTSLLTVQIDVSSFRGMEVILHLELADASDGVFDSAVFLDAFTFGILEEDLELGAVVQTAENLNVSIDPGIETEVIDVMLKGNRGTIVGGPVVIDEQTWWEVDYDVGVQGWSKAAQLKPAVHPPSEPHAFEPWAEDAIAWAEGKVDQEFLLNVAFVADSFAQYLDMDAWWPSAIDAAGDLYRFDQEPEGWKLGNIPRGAVVFFDTTKEPYNPDGHVGIYLGNGEIIHAYGIVKIDPLNTVSALPGVGRWLGWAYPPEIWRPDAYVPPIEPPVLDIVFRPDIVIPKYINVYMLNGNNEWYVQKLLLEDYLLGVVQAEMHPDYMRTILSTYEWFEEFNHELTDVQLNELLKAQAVAARTYAVAAINGMWTMGRQLSGGKAHILAGPQDQAWVEGPYCEEVISAVFHTMGQIITYPGGINDGVRGGAIEAFYSTYGNKKSFPFYFTLTPTQAGWLNDWPYLKPVFSYGPMEYIPGTEIGHGVGMSQWGAAVLAAMYANYLEILTYYYTGVYPNKASVIKGMQSASFQSFEVLSPVELRVFDSAGRVTGLVNGVIKAEIPGSFYDPIAKRVTIVPALDTYRIELHGVEDGTYDMYTMSYVDGETIVIEFQDVQTEAGKEHDIKIDWQEVQAGGAGVTITVGNEVTTIGKPNAPDNPSPQNNAIGIDPENVILSWTVTDAPQNFYYEIYFGNTPQSPLMGKIGPFPVGAEPITYSVGDLEPGVKYYWQIKVINEHGLINTGPLWSFTTLAHVTGVTLLPEEATINVGATQQLTASIEPAYATNQDVTWKSSDETVATVDENGLVTGVTVGEAIITVTTVDGEFYDTSVITVEDKLVILSGLTYEVNATPLAGVSITLYKDDAAKTTATSDQNGSFEIIITQPGNYQVVARKEGFTPVYREIAVSTQGQDSSVNLDFRGMFALIPSDPDIWYVLDCIALWKYPAQYSEDELDVWKTLDVIAAWKY